METGKQVNLTFHGVDFTDVHMNSYKPMHLAKEGEVKLSIQPKVQYDKENKANFFIIIDTILSTDEHFKLELRAIGTFSMSKDIDENMKNSFVNTNAPAILFPYIRAFVNTLSSNLGQNVTGPILLPPQFFVGKLEELQVVTEDSNSNS